MTPAPLSINSAEQPDYKCPQCSRMLPSHFDLIKHLRIDHGNNLATAVERAKVTGPSGT